ncbi:ATP-dependent Zn protease [Leptolyngbya sp. FACHB-261]|uniref:ATP-dependent Zn protease n=1 Tax=Leptolyngbya sp. FACHB-261 TaxID=2692806 RepID=UPI001682DA67|nr:ATP-dependent Zn protease [Leptolyngbya sp. FACHB-261]MBD2103607.1 ATP-dependent Zn protease [Leptolyngbya sp. FACHB-261]
MSSPSLNLIAITVFTLTLSTLLGPLLNLSPVVPAAAVAVGMALFATDRLVLAGRGGNLLQNWLTPQQRERVLIHEAGHFLVAYLSGVPILDYTLSPWETFRRGLGGSGGVVFDRTALEAQLSAGTLSAQLLERYCAIWMAGVVAEQQVFGNAQGGADDRLQLRLALSQLRKGSSERLNPEMHERWATLRARTLMTEHSSAYKALLAQMRQRASVEDCCAAIDQHRDQTVDKVVNV